MTSIIRSKGKGKTGNQKMLIVVLKSRKNINNLVDLIKNDPCDISTPIIFSEIRETKIDKK